jgi:hypothetical protein
MSAKLFVPGGLFVHASGGEMSRASPVYFAGIGRPLAKAALVSCIFITCPLADLGSCEQPAVTRPASNNAVKISLICALMPCCYHTPPEQTRTFHLPQDALQ